MAKIVHKFDVHILKEQDEQNNFLSLFRFPALESQLSNHDSSSPYRPKLSLKPKSLAAKLEVPLNTKSNHFDEERARLLASKGAGTSAFKKNFVDQHVYSCNHPPVKDEQLFVGQLINNKLILRPVPNLFTLRSDLTHLDQREEVDPGQEEVHALNVKFAGPDRHTSNIPKPHVADKVDPQDQFQQLTFHSVDSHTAISERALLFGEQKPKIKLDPDVVKEELLLTDVLETCSVDIKPKIELISQSDIPSQESQETIFKRISETKKYVKDCLLKAKIVSFNEILDYIAFNSDNKLSVIAKDVVDCLNDFAVLVQGNWVVKSEILYGDSSVRDSSAVTGIPMNNFIIGRDYLLWLFTQNRFVRRIDFLNKARLPDFDTLELLKQVATFRKENLLWEFKLPTDDEFVKKYPDIAQRQEIFWKVRRANKLSM